MSTYMVFPTSALATVALTQIHTNAGYPVSGKNAATGKIVLNAAATTQWAIPTATALGTWVFLLPPVASYIKSVVNFTLAAFNPAWFPVVNFFPPNVVVNSKEF